MKGTGSMLVGHFDLSFQNETNLGVAQACLTNKKDHFFMSG